MAHRARNRHKSSRLDSLISGLEEEVAKGNDGEVEPDLMREAMLSQSPSQSPDTEAASGFVKAQQAARTPAAASSRCCCVTVH